MLPSYPFSLNRFLTLVRRQVGRPVGFTLKKVISNSLGRVTSLPLGRLRLKCDGTRWRTVGEVKGKQENGVGNQ